MTSPVPGFTYPSPRTWSIGDIVTAARLRGDMTNLADLYAGNARPAFVAQNFENPVVSGVTQIDQSASLRYLNTWNVPFPDLPNEPNFDVPFAGWYLLQVSLSGIGGLNVTSNQYRYATGLTVTQNGVALSNLETSSVPGDGVSGDNFAGAGMVLIMLNTFANSGDIFSFYANTSSGAMPFLQSPVMMAEWVALPTSGYFAPLGGPLLNYTGPYGTVVASPAAAAAFPSGQGTTITNGGGIVAGATSVTVAANAGMVTGGTLGLDYINAQLNQNVAEAVSITSVAGTTIGISATLYAHAQGAPVAVPVSAAFLNQQCRDAINFLSYPPLLKVSASTTQSIPSTGFPPTVGGNPTNQVTNLTASSLGLGVDTFSGFASNAYTIPVAGVYLVYAQIPYAGSAGNAFACGTGVSVNGGTIQWGTLLRCPPSPATNQVMTPTYRKLMRFSKGDVVTLWAFQAVGSNMSTVNSPTQSAGMILVFRGF